MRLFSRSRIGAIDCAVDRNTRAHSRRNRDGLHIAALSCCRLHTKDLIVDNTVVLSELFRGEAHLAENNMADAITVGAILNAAAFELLDCLCNIWRNRAELGVRHKTARTEDHDQDDQL